MTADDRRYRLGDMKKLFAMSWGICALPRCEERLARPEWPRVLAEICHIHGLRQDAARYDPGLDADYLNSYENLILLCRNCHLKVDQLDVQDYPADRLLEIKAAHERGRGSSRWCNDEEIARFIVKLQATLEISFVDRGVSTGRRASEAMSSYLAAIERGDADESAENCFVTEARAYSDRKGISYAAWRELGVPPAVLRRAGISRGGRSRAVER